MRVLFDQGTPVPLRQSLTQHEVTTAYEGFEVLVTTDSNLKYQQNLDPRRIAIVVLSTPSWRRIERAVRTVVDAIGRASAGSVTEIEIP